MSGKFALRLSLSHFNHTPDGGEEAAQMMDKVEPDDEVMKTIVRPKCPFEAFTRLRFGHFATAKMKNENEVMVRSKKFARERVLFSEPKVCTVCSAFARCLLGVCSVCSRQIPF